MAVTHADLAPNRRSTHLGAFLMVLSILLGLFCFILSLIAEATRSQVRLIFSKSLISIWYWEMSNVSEVCR